MTLKLFFYFRSLTRTLGPVYRMMRNVNFTFGRNKRIIQSNQVNKLKQGRRGWGWKVREFINEAALVIINGGKIGRTQDEAAVDFLMTL